MRVDKFLKVSRLIKRRTLAKEVCDGGRVSINDRLAKAGSEVAIGDRVRLQFPRRLVEVEVVLIKESVRAEEAKDLYRVVRDEPLEG
ncbi:RNA-binding S4 domain-containing protein [Heliophilum fasciatum]|uniref:RQC P-site tRNA stabilizing factor n=1 Tax=Heliophilum fasciatum TaxID=35700 RepID=A0A4R2RXZ9_9FIRM|nr:RNA-binding S4 domain-containing protein [Heliophilum fasciatum]MCW2277031.1 ribosomal 50S subunit-recycling heat shock protein [Heliophilum fasciatum]TCP68443.1 ribosomal 50S subunit-recycling heat shock protein [Heliophilum fasciatum]